MRLWRANWRYLVGIVSLLSAVFLFSLMSQALVFGMAYDSPLLPVRFLAELVIGVLLLTLGWRWCFLPLRPSVPDLLHLYSFFLGLMLLQRIEGLRVRHIATADLLVTAAAVGLLGFGVFGWPARNRKDAIRKAD